MKCVIATWWEPCVCNLLNYNLLIRQDCAAVEMAQADQHCPARMHTNYIWHHENN